MTERGLREADVLTVIDELSLLEQEVFLRCLIKMVRTLQQQGQVFVAHMCVTCNFFRPNVYSDSHRPHHCALVNVPFGDRHLRLECPEHLPAELQLAAQA